MSPGTPALLTAHARRAAFAGKTLAGALALDTGSADPCADVVRACTGNRSIAMTSSPVPFDVLAGEHRSRSALPRPISGLVSSNVALQLRTRPRGIRTESVSVFGTSSKNEVSTAIHQEFLPSALADGRCTAAPGPQIIGRGLEHVQQALDAQRQGVSARKVVVTL